MLNYLKNEANKTYTENGAVAFSSTESDCLDLFSSIGAMRHRSEEDIISAFVKAYTENRELALKTLFYARDVRGGLGERRVFRIILKWLAENNSLSVIKNLGNIAEYGRFDDLLSLFDTPVEKAMLDYIKTVVGDDLHAINHGGEVSLLGKWLPSVNASCEATKRKAKKVAKHLEMSERIYRLFLTETRARIRIIENNLRTKDYTFDYSKQPSKAMMKYRKAFIRNDRERYAQFLYRVERGEAKLNTDTLMPYELVHPYISSGWTGKGFMRSISEEEKRSLNATWSSLPVYDTDEDVLPVIDTSGSMYWNVSPSPASVALSLGLYFAEHNKGAFRNHFIEFSNKPQLIGIKGDTFADRLRYVASFNEIADTNLEAVFTLILDTAVKNGLKQESLPKKLLIVSDMEFNYCVSGADESVFENAKRRFAEKGYVLPEVIFWNVACRNNHRPVTKNEQGVCLVSGCTPRIFSAVVDNKLSELTPYKVMLEILGSERYDAVAA